MNKSLFTSVRQECYSPPDQPLRPIRQWVNDALVEMGARFSAVYEVEVKGERPSIAPEKLMAP